MNFLLSAEALDAALAELLRNNQFKLTPNSNRENKPRRRGFTLGPSIPVRLEILS